MNTFKLLTERRFGPFFGVQFFGALNDNIFKNALVIIIAFKAASETESGLLINLAGGLFILPFFLFSAVAGQIADKYEKSKIMRYVKIVEIAIMLLGAIGFFNDNALLLFVTLFLMGTQSAFFSPAKYSVLPQHLEEDELMAGNALVEMGTFMAILIGTLAGGLLAGQHNAMVISISIVGVALVGYIASRFVPLALPTAPDLKLNWNPFSQSIVLTKIIRKKDAIFNSILGISWFWYFGATVLAQLPNYTKHFLNGDETVVTMLLAVFSLSVGIGSILCAKLSRGEIELGLVPLGALGMTIFTGDLFFIDYVTVAGDLNSVSSLFGSASAAAAQRAIFDITMIGIFSSFFIVPLYALIQYRADSASRSRVIAANNIFNAIFMVASALITMMLFKIGFNTIDVFLYTAILNFVVSCYIFLLIPEFVMRFCTWALAGSIYRMTYSGRDIVPRQGAAVIVCNHVSFIDWFVVTAACRRPVRFVMDHNIFKIPGIGWIFRLAKAIPIAPAKENTALKEKAFERIALALKDGDLVCIFPEGKITFDGQLNAFKPGIDRILASDPVPVIPMAINGLWGSFFSRKGGAAMKSRPKPSRRHIDVRIQAALPPSTKATQLEAHIKAILA